MKGSDAGYKAMQSDSLRRTVRIVATIGEVAFYAALYCMALRWCRHLAGQPAPERWWLSDGPFGVVLGVWGAFGVDRVLQLQAVRRRYPGAKETVGQANHQQNQP